MSLDPKNPEAFWNELFRTDPDAAYELALAAPKLAKWKTSKICDYLDHVRPQTRSKIVGLYGRVDEPPMDKEKIEASSKAEGYHVVKAK